MILPSSTLTTLIGGEEIFSEIYKCMSPLVLAGKEWFFDRSDGGDGSDKENGFGKRGPTHSLTDLPCFIWTSNPAPHKHQGLLSDKEGEWSNIPLLYYWERLQLFPEFTTKKKQTNKTLPQSDITGPTWTWRPKFVRRTKSEESSTLMSCTVTWTGSLLRIHILTWPLPPP